MVIYELYYVDVDSWEFGYSHSFYLHREAAEKQLPFLNTDTTYGTYVVRTKEVIE